MSIELESSELESLMVWVRLVGGEGGGVCSDLFGERERERGLEDDDSKARLWRGIASHVEYGDGPVTVGGKF